MTAGPQQAREKMGLIFIAPSPPPYMGPSVATDILLNSRFTGRFRVLHLDIADHRSLKNVGRLDLPNILLPFKHYFRLLQWLLFSRCEGVYLLLCQTTLGFLRDLPFIALPKLFGKKVICHLRGSAFREYYNGASAPMKLVVRRTLRGVDRMIVLGESCRGLFDGLIEARRISVVPNGLDLEVDGRGPGRRDASRPSILFLSNLVAAKGFFDVLASVEIVRRRHAGVSYVFAGSWYREQDRLRYEGLVRHAGLAGSVRLAGIVAGRDKIRLLEEADIFVFPPSAAEGQPWVILEAMAAGLPIVATDQGCIRECVIDGENGFIVPPGSPGAIAAKILFLIEHPEERRRLGRKSRQLYETRYTEERFVAGMIEAIRLGLKPDRRRDGIFLGNARNEP